MSNCQIPQGHPTRCGCPPQGAEQVSSTWLAQLRSEYSQLGDACAALRARVAELTKDRDDCLAARAHYASLYGEAVGQRDQLAGALNRLITATSLSEYGMALSDARAALAASASPIKTPSPQ